MRLPIRHLTTRFLVATCSLLILCGQARACLWDRDTLNAEATGLPEVVDVIVGRFERPPPLFYEMRLARVTAQLETSPDDLAAYDDAGVALDRLRRGDEAIALMARKKARLDRRRGDEADARAHRYRYHANLGTFHAHRWLRSGAPRERLADLQAARTHVAAAIEINPQAHFGRERYQLLAIDWLLAAPSEDGDPRADTLFWALRDTVDGDLVAGLGGNRLARAGYTDAVEGLAGLIVLGDAWQSVDIHYALAIALKEANQFAAARLAARRAWDLASAARAAGRPASLAADFSEMALVDLGARLSPFDRGDRLLRYYDKATAAAATWQAQREAYMLSHLQAGRHPDTDPTFWQDYREVAVPRLDSDRPLAGLDPRLLLWGVLTLCLLPVAGQIAVRVRRRSAAPAAGSAGDGQRTLTAYRWPIGFALLLTIVFAIHALLIDLAVAAQTLAYALIPSAVLALVWSVTGRLIGRWRADRRSVLAYAGYALVVLTLAMLAAQLHSGVGGSPGSGAPYAVPASAPAA